jgi:hypothetical protein
MGDAKRRRLTQVPVGGFRAGEGTVAFTLDIAGWAPVSVVLAVGDLDALLSEGPQVSPSRRRDLRWHAKQRVAMVGMFTRGGVAVKEDVALFGLWLALNYPGDGVRRQVAAAIRQRNAAHVTMAIDRRGMMALAVADEFKDLDDILTVVAGITEPIIMAAEAPADTLGPFLGVAIAQRLIETALPRLSSGAR